MNNRGVAIKYGDVAPEAKENFAPSVSESKFDTVAQLQQYNLNFPNYASPTEEYQTVLNGTATALPDTPEETNLGIWSEQLSGENGAFAEPIVLELSSEGQYSSQGITLTFDTYNNIFATSINIKWYRDSELLSDVNFTPNSAFYFCHNKIDNYNKLILTFYAINMPKNYLKLRVIDYGYGTVFYGKELRNVKLIQELDPISTQISINTADFTIDSKSNIEYSFQAKQPLSVFFNGELKATTFVKSSKRKSKFLWEIQSEDYIGLLDSIPFYGDIYENENAVEIIDSIFKKAKVPYSIDDSFANIILNGYIPITTCREALMQVCFAIGAVVDTSDSDVVKIFKLPSEISQTIPLSRIMQGQSFNDDETVTDVEILGHKYRETREEVELYDSVESGDGDGIMLTFSEPLHDFDIENGEIIESSANHIIFNANEACIVRGYKYEHITFKKRKHNPIVLASELEKVVSIENATLITAENIDTTLERCFEWLTKVNTTNLKIVEGKHIIEGGIVKYGEVKYGTVKYGGVSSNVTVYDKVVNVGDLISTETEYLGIITGRAIKQTFSLAGGITIKDTVLK